MPEETVGAAIAETPELTDPDYGESAEVEPSEDPEVADPDEVVEDESTEPPEEPTDVPEGKRSRDSAFAEMRRAREEAERQRDELLAQIEELERANREADLIAAGKEMGLTDEEIQQVLDDNYEAEEQERQFNRLNEENERLNQQLMDIQIDKMMEEDLRNIQAIDPTVKSLEDLGEDFFKFRAALDGVDAYFAMKQKQAQTEFRGAPPIGKANQASVPREYYTSAELDSMSQEEILANWDKVQRSLEKL